MSRLKQLIINNITGKTGERKRQQVIETEAQIQKAIKEQETRSVNARAESTMNVSFQ